MRSETPTIAIPVANLNIVLSLVDTAAVVLPLAARLDA
jgi:hypothetical protein